MCQQGTTQTRRGTETRPKTSILLFFFLMRGCEVYKTVANIHVCKRPRGLSNTKRCRDEFGVRRLCSDRGCRGCRGSERAQSVSLTERKHIQAPSSSFPPPPLSFLHRKTIRFNKMRIFWLFFVVVYIMGGELFVLIVATNL